MTEELQKAILEAVIELANIPFAPQEPAQQKALMRQIAAFANQPDAVRWCVHMAAVRWTRWLGPAELRGIYCSRFPPADGISGDCVETVGLTADDNEAAYLEAQAAETDCKYAQWKREAQRLPESERKANQQLQEAVGWHASVKRIQ